RAAATARERALQRGALADAALSLRRRENKPRAVQAVAQMCRRRAVAEDMPHVARAALAIDLGAQESLPAIGTDAHRVIERAPKARPAGLAVVFRSRGKQRQPTASAGIETRALFMLERT